VTKGSKRRLLIWMIHPKSMSSSKFVLQLASSVFRHKKLVRSDRALSVGS